jgi:hypothetical protein
MATSENTVLISFNVQLRSKQTVSWTILPVDRVNTIVLFVCVFIFCFYFQSNMGRVFIFCFYFQQFKNITQISSILLFWQTNNTIVFTLSTGRIVPGNICLERNYIKTDEDSVFTRSHLRQRRPLKISADGTFLLPYRKKNHYF